jgi:hypothetical protein
MPHSTKEFSLAISLPWLLKINSCSLSHLASHTSSLLVIYHPSHQTIYTFSHIHSTPWAKDIPSLQHFYPPRQTHPSAFPWEKYKFDTQFSSSEVLHDSFVRLRNPSNRHKKYHSHHLQTLSYLVHLPSSKS